MLGGARDEVVPRSQMQELWAIVRNRGRDTANKKPPVGSVKGKGKEREDTQSESGSDDRKVPPPKIVVDGGNIYIEFPDGMHSELCLKGLVAVSCSSRLCR